MASHRTPNPDPEHEYEYEYEREHNPEDARDPGHEPEHDRGGWIRPTTAVGVFGLAAAAFVLSYDALHALALASGIRPELAWIWPLVVDGFIVVASLSVLAANRAGRSAGYPWVLVGLFSALSVGFNIAHAPDVLTAQAVAAIPPLALMLAFELLMRQVPAQTRPRRADRHTDPTTGRTDPAASGTGPDHPAMLEPPGPAMVVPPGDHAGVADAHNPASGGDPPDRTGSPATSGSPVRDQARQLFAAMVAAGEPVTGAALARALGISDRYGQRLLAEFRAESPIDDLELDSELGQRGRTEAASNGTATLTEQERTGQ